MAENILSSEFLNWFYLLNLRIRHTCDKEDFERKFFCISLKLKKKNLTLYKLYILRLLSTGKYMSALFIGRGKNSCTEQILEPP